MTAVGPVRRPRRGGLIDQAINGWHRQAACQGEDPRLFVGPEGERLSVRQARETEAKAVCRECPVRSECLEYALSRPEPHGVYGGLGEDERVVLRRHRMRQAAAAGVAS